MSESSYTEPVLPLPGVISSYREDASDQAQWDIVPSAGDFGAGVDFAAGVLAIPLSGDAYSQLLQLEQLVKVRISPLDPEFPKRIASLYKSYGMNEAILRAAESARINAVTDQFAQVKGIKREPNGSEKKTGINLATANTTQAWDRAVAFTLEHHGTKAFDSFASGVRSINPEWSNNLRKLNRRLSSVFSASALDVGSTVPREYPDGVTGPMGYSYTIDAALSVRDYLSGGSKTPDDIKESKKREDDKRAEEYGSKPEGYDFTKGELDGEEVKIEDDLPEDYEFPSGEDDQFAKLIVDDTIPLTVEVPKYMHRKRRAMVSGRRIAYPSRMLTDPQRRVFGSKVRVKGGIVIIDISGSMSLTQKDIETIVDEAPAAIVLAYSHDKQNNEAPNAWILANRGWRVKEIPDDIGRKGNGVDGPALLWAIRKRNRNEPIIWVCDGMVTSCNDRGSTPLTYECAKLVKKHKIIVIPSVEEAVTMFKAGKLVNKPAGRLRQALLGQL